MAGVIGRGVVKAVGKSTQTSACDMMDARGPCCNDNSAGRKEAKDNDMRVCEKTSYNKGTHGGNGGSNQSTGPGSGRVGPGMPNRHRF